MSRFIICRSQAIFEASVVADGLPALDKSLIDNFVVRKDQVGMPILDTYLGRGPASFTVEPSAVLFFDHGEEAYPQFSIPGEGPLGAGLRGATQVKQISLQDDATAFVANVTIAHPAELDPWDAAVKNQLSPESSSLIQGILRNLKSILDTIIGTYALYQYPLVWKHLYERHSYTFYDSEIEATTRAFKITTGDTFLPFRLNATTKMKGTEFVDSVHASAAALVASNISEPLVFLKDSLWEDDIRTRFLLQFWIVEYLSEQRSAGMGVDADVLAFVKAIQQLTAQHLPEHLDLFKRKKGELLRRPLADKVRSCCEALRIQYDDGVFKKAKRVRDNLSHGSAYKESDLLDMERYIRELSRYILRRELEASGIFLDGVLKPMAEWPLLVVPFVRVPPAGQLLTTHFTLSPPTQ